jgi:carbon-monoxide dehydrogenase iron sulfur subunit
MMRRVYCDTRKCLSCSTCEIACALRHSPSDNLAQALQGGVDIVPLVRVRQGPLGPALLRCHHCEDAACIDACKTGAMSRDPEAGKVLIDQHKCVGCWMCVMVCPFGAVFPIESTGTAMKCDLCDGYDAPACVAACPTRALHFEEFEDFERRYHTQIPVGAWCTEQGA